MCKLLRLFLFAACCAGTAQIAAAQAPSSPPAGMTCEQFDAVVDAASRSVVEKLKTTPRETTASTEETVESRVNEFVNRAGAALAALPEAGARIASIPRILAEQRPERGLLTYVLLLAVATAAALAVERALRRATQSLRTWIAERAAVRNWLGSLWSLVSLLLLDVVGLAGVWLVSYGAVGVWFQGGDAQALLARAILTGVFAWRLYMLAFRAVLRPELPQARLATVDDKDAHDTYYRISGLVLFAIFEGILVRALPAAGASMEAAAAGRIVANIILFCLIAWFCIKSRRAVAQWFAGAASTSRMRLMLSQNWHLIAIPFFALLALAIIYGAVVGRHSQSAAMILTMNLVLAVIFFETLGDYLRHRSGPDAAIASPDAAGAAAPREDLPGLNLVFRCLRAALLIIVATVILQTWTVHVFGLVDESAWRGATHTSVVTGVALFASYVAWELVRYLTDRYMGANRTVAAASSNEDGPRPPTASRLATLAPLLRVAAAIAISIIAVLVVLTELGVNITPLIAGASVLGLAVSFGSQTLVRDIVSGMFYLADDAFRVGEYIDCGKAKGTVEGFTLRSLKLRHQNGQVHTIPFGQLGQITNFSRDWSTVKFNLRVAPDTDLEKVRKSIKKVGIAMAEDPEFKDDFLEPLKLQGIAELQDNAMVVRAKFTVKPQNPSYIQRQAMKRIVQAFADNGISFATATISVQTRGEAGDAAAAGAMALAKAKAEADQAAG